MDCSYALCHIFLLLVLRISTHLYNSIILILWEEERLFPADSVYIILTLNVDLLYTSSLTVELQITTKPAGHIFRRVSTDSSSEDMQIPSPVVRK